MESKIWNRCAAIKSLVRQHISTSAYQHISTSKFLLALLITLLLCAACADRRPTRIFMAGDSTMADKALCKTVLDSISGDSITDLWPERGWGMMLPEFLSEGFVVDNRAKNGRSTRTFISEGLWGELIRDVRPGDYVVLQFGHNDASESKVDRYTPPDDYAKNLQKFVDEVRAKNATPILCTPVVRRKFDAGGQLSDTHGVYPGLVRRLAKKDNVVMVDMYEKTWDLLTELGEEKSAELFMNIPPGQTKVLPNGLTDNTHYVEEGARITARLFVEGLEEQGVRISIMR